MRWGSDASRARRRRPLAVLAAGMAALTGTAGSARAADGADATYGRLQGDVTVVVGAGLTVANQGPRGEGELRLRYLETVGIFGSYEDGPLVGSAAEPQRVIATGLEVRPLFLYRWLKGHETSAAAFDLLLDSLGLELGAAFQQPSGSSFESRPALQVGGMLEFPLFGKATGPWLAVHGGMRWNDRSLASGATSSPDEQSYYLSITLAWHQDVVLHVVDVNDRRSP
jgi:hypothetical protein